MYKLISAKNKDGNDKIEFINDMKSKHGDLSGDFVYYEFMKAKLSLSEGESCSCCFEWNDDSGKMMRTSYVESVSEYCGTIVITTENSVYEFVEI